MPHLCIGVYAEQVGNAHRRSKIEKEPWNRILVSKEEGGGRKKEKRRKKC